MEKALIELDGKSTAVGDRVAKALSDWKGGTFEEEEVKDYFQHEWENGSRVVTERLASQMNIRRVEGMTALHEACCNGEVAMAKALLKMGTGVKAEDEWCETPLHKACYHGHEGVVKLLVKAGAEVEAANKDGCTPLFMASLDRSAGGHCGVVKQLLTAQANLEAVHVKSGWTPLLLASDAGHTSVVKVLLDAGAETMATCKNGKTPLSYASYHGHERVVKLLITAGANTGVTDKGGWTPEKWARQQGHVEVVCLLTKGNLTFNDAIALRRIRTARLRDEGIPSDSEGSDSDVEFYISLPVD